MQTRRMTKAISPSFPPNAVKVPHLTGNHLSRPPLSLFFCLLSKKGRDREGERMRMAAGTQREKRPRHECSSVIPPPSAG